MKTKKIIAIIALFYAYCIAFASPEIEAFKTVRNDSKPWCYWWWVNGNVDEKTITADLENMKKIGFGGFLMFDSRGYWDDENHLILPPPACEFMDDYWRKCFKFSMDEAKRLGLKASSNLSNSGGLLKGPWLLGKDVPKRLICKITPLNSNSTNNIVLEDTNRKFSADVAAFAIKYDGEKFDKPTEWINAGDGLYSMQAHQGVNKDNKITRNRTALEVVDLSENFDSNKKIKFEAKDGKWVFVQFAWTTLDGHDMDVDVLDADAVLRFYNRMAGKLKEEIGSHYADTLTHFYSVSWEGSVPTWSISLKSDFKKFTGYDIKKWIPVLAGFSVDGKDNSDKFMTDFRRARNLAFKENFYVKMKKIAQSEGLLWHSESGGPWSRKPQIFGEADQLEFLGVNDMPQGEFWVDKDERYFVKPIANAANIYGKNLVAVESFTHMVEHWSVSPAVLKPSVDKMFCDGGNFVVWHTYTCSPEKFGKPGVEYFAGTHINRNVTWQEQAEGFLTYIARCQYMLRLGLPVVDFCAYVGDMPYQDWGRWNDRLFKDSKTKIPSGFNYDIINNEILLKSAKVKDSKLVLPSGLSYSAIIVELERETVSPKALKKILEFKRQGLPVICVPRNVTGAAGLSEDSAKSCELAKALFENPIALEQWLDAAKINPDCVGDFDWIHRKDGEIDIYFLAGSGKGKQIFRAKGIPVIWNPMDGSCKVAGTWRSLEDGRTEVEFDFPENGSNFVLFGQKNALSLPMANTNLKNALDLGGDWNVVFEKDSKELFSAKFPKLVSWSESSDKKIKYFSGSAIYSKKINFEAQPTCAYLELNNVAVIAQVWVNGKDCGVAWTPPFKVDISNALVRGENEIKIKVVNNWVNSLIGDANLPAKDRVTKSNMALTKDKPRRRWCGYGSESKLQTSGLIGPVKILF